MNFLRLKILTMSFLISLSAGAQVEVQPKRILLNEKQRSIEVTLRLPPSEKKGSYILEPVLYTMNEAGKLQEVNSVLLSRYKDSLVGMLKISPQTVQLEAQKNQNIQIEVLAPKSLPPGMYRAHIRIRPENSSNVQGQVALSDSEVLGLNKSKREGVSLDFGMKLGVAVPVYFSFRASASAVKLYDIKLLQSGSGSAPQVELWMEPQNAQTTYGDVYLVHGELKELSEKDPALKGLLRGVASFGGKRRVKLSLTDFDPAQVPEADKKNYKIQFRKPLEEGGAVIAESPLF